MYCFDDNFTSHFQMLYLDNLFCEARNTAFSYIPVSNAVDSRGCLHRKKNLSSFSKEKTKCSTLQAFSFTKVFKKS